MKEIQFTDDAANDLSLMRKFDQKRILQAIEVQLPHQGDQESRNRKRLRPNKLAAWELRVGDFRVFYDVDADGTLIKVVAIAYKEGSRLFVHGKEYEL